MLEGMLVVFGFGGLILLAVGLLLDSRRGMICAAIGFFCFAAVVFYSSSQMEKDRLLMPDSNKPASSQERRTMP